MPPRSQMMDELYGPEIANRVYDRLQELDPALNKEIQRVAYDHFWSRPGLSTRDKSLVTVASLIALGKEEQIKIHLNGFLGSGGSMEEIGAAMIQLSVSAGPEAAVNGVAALKEVLLQRGIPTETINQIVAKFERLARTAKDDTAWSNPGLSLRDKNLINVSAAVAIGRQSSTTVAIAKYLADGGSIDDLKNSLIHQIVYCGFPAAMNGFAALRELRK